MTDNGFLSASALWDINNNLMYDGEVLFDLPVDPGPFFFEIEGKVKYQYDEDNDCWYCERPERKLNRMVKDPRLLEILVALRKTGYANFVIYDRDEKDFSEISD